VDEESTRGSPVVGDRAPDVELPDDGGTMTSLSGLWRGRPLVLLFARHFG
jgi:peroxiredoxin